MLLHSYQSAVVLHCESVERLSDTGREELLITVHSDKAVTSTTLMRQLTVASLSDMSNGMRFQS